VARRPRGGLGDEGAGSGLFLTAGGQHGGKLHTPNSRRLADVWPTFGKSASSVASDYDNWHAARVKKIAAQIGQDVSKRNDRSSVSAKFLNTFMHQIMKYQEPRPLFDCLHLPLDRRVFNSLRRVSSLDLPQLTGSNNPSPYALPYAKHAIVQKALWQFIRCINALPGVDFKLTSRIELNWLWL